MLSYLKGKIIHKGKSFVVLEVGNVGYRITVHEEFYAELELNNEAEVYTHQYVREDALDLYGFESWKRLELFELLLSISGIGPKSALSAVYIASAEEFRDSIVRGDPSLLTKVSGVGKKTAERAVLDLSEKIGELPSSLSGQPSPQNGGGGSNDEIEALTGLGYSRQQAMDALRQVSSDISDSGERIREALRRLGK